MPTQDDINAFTASCETACLLILAAQTNQETANRSVRVATVNDLPDLSLGTITPGTIFWVDSVNIPVIAQMGCWTGLDNRQLRSDCVVSLIYTWGLNSSGQLGDNTTTNRSSPVLITPSMSDWGQVSGGFTHTTSLKNNGTAWAWGANTQGYLGNNSTIASSSPVSVVGGFSDWCKISAGRTHTVASRTDGTAWSWGFNNFGHLGDCTTVAKSSPVSVVGGLTGWCQASAGGEFSLAVRTNGTAWSWGRNEAGQLGDLSTTAKSSPVSVRGAFSDWCQVSAGRCHALGVRTNGTAWAWGCGYCGILGNTSTANASSPSTVSGSICDWCQVNAGQNHSLAVRISGTLWSWGRSDDGILGDGTAIRKSSPVQVCGGFTDWCASSAGALHSVGVRQNGTIWTWGRNLEGQLGDNTLVSKNSPVSVVGGVSDWCQISAGYRQTFGLRVC